MGDPDVWPMLLDMSRDDCKRILRRLELEAYSNLVSVLRAQGSLTQRKRRLLQSVGQTLSISEERHKAECRRAVNSEKLATIAKHMGGPNTGTEWAIEGRRLVPLLPRLVPQTAFTAIADQVANMATTEGAKLPLPTPPAKTILSAPPLDETLQEPNVPEASKTVQMSSLSPLSPTALGSTQIVQPVHVGQTSTGCSSTLQVPTQHQAGQNEVEAVIHPESQALPYFQSPSKTEPQTVARQVTSQAQTQIQAPTQSQIHSQISQHTQSQGIQTQPHSQLHIETQTEVQIQPDSELEIKPKIPQQGLVKHDIQVQKQIQMQVETQMHLQAQSPALPQPPLPPQSQVQCQTHPPAQSQAKPQIQTLQAKLQVKPFVKPVGKPVMKPGMKPISKPIMVKPVIKPVMKQLVKPMVKVKPQVTQAGPSKVQSKAQQPQVLNKAQQPGQLQAQPQLRPVAQPQIQIQPQVQIQGQLQVQPQGLPRQYQRQSHVQPQMQSQEQSQPQLQTQVVQSTQCQHLTPAQPPSMQAPLLMVVKNEDNTTLETTSRKRPRSYSLDNTHQESVMAPPPKKEALQSPPSSQQTAAQSLQSPGAMSPQSHSHMVQQQTLQAAAAAAAAAAASPTTSASQGASQATNGISSTPRQQPQHFQQQKQLQQQQIAQPAVCQSSAIRPVPGQSTVKISRATPATTAVGSAGSSIGVGSSTHKVIIVSSTAPSILQRSLSVPVVKSVTTCAPSQPCTSTLVLNTTAQQPLQTQTSGNMVPILSSSSESTTNVPSTGNGDVAHSSVSPTTVHGGSVVVSSKLSAKVSTAPKPRPRGNSIVIPVTPNQAGVMSGVTVSGMHLKTALQAGKPGILKAGDGSGLKIMPLTNMGANTKILPKPCGSGPIYVVSSTSLANSNMSMVSRTVPSGTRVMTLSSANLPRMAVSTSQGGTHFTMNSKSGQPVHLTQASNFTTPVTSSTSAQGSIPGKPNVIVVQKGSTGFSRGVTLSHGGKEVVGKVLLGGKALASVNQSQVQVQLQTSQGQVSGQVKSTQNQPSTQPIVQTQTSQNATAVLSTIPTTRMVTVQKLPSAVVPGSANSGNVLVLDLTQEQLNNSAVISEFLASGILSSSSILNLNQDPTPAYSGGDSSIYTTASLPVTTASAIGAVSNASGSETMASADRLSQPEPSTVPCTDIFSTALSSANLNLNDFLEDSSLDDLPPSSVDGLRLAPSSVESNISNSSHSNHSMNTSSWGAGDNSQNCMDAHDCGQG